MLKTLKSIENIDNFRAVDIANTKINCHFH